MIEIPLTSQPNQFFRTTVNVGDKNIPLNFFMAWNRIAEYWQLSIDNGITGDSYISLFPLVPGNGRTRNILRQFAYWEIGQAYILPISSTASDVPGLNDWGVNHLFLWGP